MKLRIEQSILKTLVYADVFDYPLSLGELFRFLISDKKITKELLLANLLNLLSKKTERQKNLFFLKGREETVSIRKRRERYSKIKINLAKKVIQQLCLIPSIQFIGISGALALNNSEKDGDIDLFVIAGRGKLWITRFLCVGFLRIIGKGRKRNEKDVSDKICVNMFISEDKLSLPKEMQNIYGAHEVVQILPLFDRENTYQRFLNANQWVKRFLPNAFDRRTTRISTRNNAESFFSIILSLVLQFSALEFFAKKFQLWYMKGHRTRELVSDTLLAFHPIDYQQKILDEYKKRLDKYRLI